MTPDEINAYLDARIDAKMEAIANLAAKKAIQSVYADIGQGVLKKAAWILGVGLLALLMWLSNAGYLK